MAQHNIPKLRFPEFTGEWKEKKLGEIADVSKLAGYEFTKHITYEDAGSIIALRGLNIKNNNLDLKDVKYIDNSELHKLGRSKLYVNDIMFTYIGTIGEVALIKEDDKFYLAPNVSRIRVTANNVLPHYVNQYFTSDRFKENEIKQYISSSSQPALTMENVRKFKIVFPSLHEQQKIASFLSAVDKKIEQLQKKKELLELYKRGMMQKLFSREIRFKDDNGRDFPEWEEKELGGIAYTTTGSSNREDSNLDGEYTFFDRSEDIRTSNIYLFDGEAIIVAGEGQRFIPKYFIGKFDLHQRTYAIMNFKQSNGKFLFYYIDYNKSYFYSQAVGSTVKSLRLPMFNKMPVFLPHTNEQTKIADFLTAIDNKIALTDNEIVGAKTFKKGLLQQMFV